MKYELQKDAKRKIKYKDKLITELFKASRSKILTEKDLKSCRSILNHYKRKGGISPKQWIFAESLIGKAKNQVQPTEGKKQYLYAISDGEVVKLGYACDIKKRIKALQTANPKHLFLAWKYYIGRCAKTARRAESKLHCLCKEHHIKGEWFKLSCFKLVEAFKYTPK